MKLPDNWEVEERQTKRKRGTETFGSGEPRKFLKLVYTGDLPATKEEALELSITKWEILSGDLDIEQDGGVATCGLCVCYYQDECVECPVYRKTGQEACKGTPYWDFVKARAEKEAKKAAKQEAEFLRSLKDE